jgi:hypothetical protein
MGNIKNLIESIVNICPINIGLVLLVIKNVIEYGKIKYTLPLYHTLPFITIVINENNLPIQADSCSITIHFTRISFIFR